MSENAHVFSREAFMRRIQFSILLFLVSVSMSAFAKDKSIAWQEGQVLEVSNERVGDPNSLTPMVWATTYRIQGPTATYEASEFTRKHYPPARVAKGDSVKFFVKEKSGHACFTESCLDQFFMIGNDGKQYGLRLRKFTTQTKENGQ